MKPLSIVLLMLASYCAIAQEKVHPWLEQQDSATIEMLKAYGADEEYFAMQDRILEIENQAEQTKKQQKRARTVFLLLSVLGAATPTVRAIKLVRKGQLKSTEAGGAFVFSLVILICCGILFAINYGWLTLRHEWGDALNLPIAILLIASLILSLVLKRKKD